MNQQSRRTRRIQCKAFLFGYIQPFTVNLEDLEAQCSHIPLKERTQIRKVVLQKWRHKKRKHSVHAYFRKNQKRSILRADKYGDLTTAEHKILNEGRESRNNHRHAVVVPVLAKPKLHRRRKRIYESLQNRRRSQKLFRRTSY